MRTQNSQPEGRLINIVTLNCKNEDLAKQCLGALENYGRPDALSYNCLSYEFGLKEGTTNVVCIVERWNSWDDLDRLAKEKIANALPMYNQLLKNPFDPAKDTLRIMLITN
jgi:hypothetical protein